MNIEELKVTLEMLDIKYHYYFSRAGENIIFLNIADLEMEKFIKDLIAQYNLKWNILWLHGKLKGIYIIF